MASTIAAGFTRPTVVAFILVVAAAAAQAQYPAKPIRLVVPFAPGGPVDTIARAMSPKLSEALGQQLIIDNRAGAGSIIGTDVVVKAPADGYTLLITSSSIAINPSIYPKMPFDATRDLAPISQLSTSSLIVVVHPSVPAKSIKELIALAKARKGDAGGAQLQGRVVHVIDGDGLIVLVGEKRVNVRLEHIDAPEKGQAYGIALGSPYAICAISRPYRLAERIGMGGRWRGLPEAGGTRGGLRLFR